MRQGVWFRTIMLVGAVLSVAVTGGTLAQGQASAATNSGTQDTARNETYSDITPQALDAALSRGTEPFALVNVHVPYGGEIRGTDAFIPFDVIAERAGELPPGKAAPIVLYCMSRRMSEAASRTLRELGYTNVTNCGAA